MENLFSCSYDKNKKELIEGNCDKLKPICQKYFKDESKDCKKYYERLETQGFAICPYGLNSFVINERIYTSLLCKETYNKKVIESFKRCNEKINSYQIFFQNTLRTILENDYNYMQRDREYGNMMHDLRNIGTYFQNLVFDFERNHAEILDDNDVKSLTSLYELMNYRINLKSPSLDDGGKFDKNIHPIIHKLKNILKYKAKNKDIEIVIDRSQKNIFKMSRNIYLAFFIILENAIKYSDADSKIKINFEESDVQTFVFINNFGPLVESSELLHLAEKNYRGITVSKLENKYQGDGLGLYYAKELFDCSGVTMEFNTTRSNNEKGFFTVKLTFTEPIK